MLNVALGIAKLKSFYKKKNEKLRTISKWVTERYDHILSSATSTVRLVESMRYKSRGRKTRKNELRDRETNTTNICKTPEQMSKICDIQNSHRWNNQNKNKRAANFST